VFPDQLSGSFKHQTRFIERRRGLVDVRARHVHVRGRAVPAREEIAILQASEDLPRFYPAAFFDMQGLQAPGRLGCDIRLALRNHVTGRIEERVRLRRKGA